MSSRDSSPAPPSYRSRSRSPSPARDPPKKQNPPPLPPRNRLDTVHLTPDYRPGPYGFPSGEKSHSWMRNDPRSSSTQSLVPSESPTVTGRRTLLIVYIHGFMGNETSFKSFPAHVHNILTVTLAESHVVHSKIYPRYRSRGSIEYAAEEFSSWLCPHENETTDVILAGHSMGGLLAAEVTLLGSTSPTSNQALRHRILGVIAFDTPFLGMHPQVVGTGIASLFRSNPEKSNENKSDGLSSPGPQSHASTSSLVSTESMDSGLFDVPVNDPYFNPSFVNDKHIVERKGWEKAAYFLYKHSKDLTKATKQYVVSHVQFGGCLADYPGLKRRYNRIRALEDVHELIGRRDESGKILRRVRFVNYYSASSGRIKAPKTPNSGDITPTEEMSNFSLENDSSRYRSPSSAGPSQISREITPQDSQESIMPTDGAAESKFNSIGQLGEPTKTDIPHSTTDTDGGYTESLNTNTEDQSQSTDLDRLSSPPQMPPIPETPTPVDPAKYETADSLKAARQEHAKALKAYDRVLKEREKVLRDHEKAIRKQEKSAVKNKAKEEKAFAKALAKAEKSQKLLNEVGDEASPPPPASAGPGSSSEQIYQETQPPVMEEKKRPKRDRKFCMLPPRNVNGGIDSTWIRVYMEGFDEVEAHTSLFLVSDTYEELVGDTAARIEQWVNEDMTKKLLLEEALNG